MGGLLKAGGAVAGTALGGPLGGVIGSGLGGFAGTAAEGGNLYDSLGSGIMGGASQGIANGMNPQIPVHGRIGDAFGSATAPKVDMQTQSLMDVLARARKPKNRMYAGQEMLGMPQEFWNQMPGPGTYGA